MTLRLRIAAIVLILAVGQWTGAAAAATPADQALWGVHRIWGQDQNNSKEFVNGSFVTVFWRDVNPAPGVYDFSTLDAGLKKAQSRGLQVTVNLKGKFKPDYLFDEIPYYPGKLADGVHDEKGSLQYWHPDHIRRYRQLLEAFADYIVQTPYRSTIYSVRGNLNALGTEHSGVAEQYRAKSLWKIPPGVSFEAYTDQKNIDYKKFVAESLYELIAPNTFLFLRTNLLIGASGQSMPSVVVDAIRAGRVGLVHTSSVPEPDKVSTENKYKVHIQYGKNGNTPIYAEPYAASDRGPQPPAQWNYWRILGDLHAGVTIVAVYGKDLDQAINPEFRGAFDFANRYAGFQLQSTRSNSPGAWVAFREGGQWMSGDYTFLMERIENNNTVALSDVGATTQRQGAFARRISSGDSLNFRVDPAFLESLRGDDVAVRVTYLDSNEPKLDVVTPSGSSRISGGSSRLWKTGEVVVNGTQLANAATDGVLTIRAKSVVTLHMVEILKSSSNRSANRVANPKPPSAILVQ